MSTTSGALSEPLETRRSSIHVLFRPQSVALIGASDRAGSVGRAVLENLRSAQPIFPVHAVNPSSRSILGWPAYSSIGDVPDRVDLAVIATPAKAVPGVVRECAARQVKGVVVISAGFRETGEQGRALEQEVLAEARAGGIRLVGPNSLGVMCPSSGLNATFATSMAARGTVAFLSQSGAMCSAMLEWSEREAFGFSAVVSLGSMADVGWGDLIDYLAYDPNTRSIVLYMETVGDARGFLSAAREVALSKPIIVLKSGRTEAGTKAAMSHTGSLAGRDQVLDAAFRRCGVLRVNNISDVFYMTDVLAKQPRPTGPRLSIVTNAGGPGVLAADSLLANGGRLAELPDSVRRELDECLPPHWSAANPIDVLGNAGAEQYGRAIESAAGNPESDGLLVIMTPQGLSNPTEIAEVLAKSARSIGKPVLASWMGGRSAGPGVRLLNNAGIPVFPYPDTAAKAFCYLWHYSDHLRSLYETPTLTSDEHTTDREYAARELISAVRAEGRVVLDESESKAVLALYGIPTVRASIAHDESQAVDAAARIGYPVVVKLRSSTLTHKSEVGGVKLHLANAAAVGRAFVQIREAVLQRGNTSDFNGVTVQPMISWSDGYELILGCNSDEQLGPVLLFGSGGEKVEIYRDECLGLPPLNMTLAYRMMEQTRIWKALKGIRGRAPVNTDALAEMLVRFSRLVVEQPWIREIDVNPFLASPAGLLALDARIVLHGPDRDEDSLPKPAIRPYPVQYTKSWVTKNDVVVTIRPIRPEDEHRMIAFHERLSEKTVYLRYFHHLKLQQRIAHERLARICFIDYDRQMVLVAERTRAGTGQREIIAVARLVKMLDPREAELAVVVADEFQGKGVGTEMARMLIQIARDERAEVIHAEMLAENSGIVSVFRKLGFDLTLDMEEAVIRARLRLT